MLDAKKINHPYITCNPNISQGSPTISGTRMRVIDIAIEYEKLSYTPDQIVDAHPHIRLEQVHDALSYYYENIDYFNERVKNQKKIIEKISKKYKSKLPDIKIG